MVTGTTLQLDRELRCRQQKGPIYCETQEGSLRRYTSNLECANFGFARLGERSRATIPNGKKAVRLLQSE